MSLIDPNHPEMKECPQKIGPALQVLATAPTDLGPMATQQEVQQKIEATRAQLAAWSKCAGYTCGAWRWCGTEQRGNGPGNFVVGTQMAVRNWAAEKNTQARKAGQPELAQLCGYCGLAGCPHPSPVQV